MHGDAAGRALVRGACEHSFERYVIDCMMTALIVPIGRYRATLRNPAIRRHRRPAMSTASLYYHDCRGRGEAIRLALHDRLGWDAVGDERLTRETRRSERWATELKQSPVTGPFGTLPVLTIDGIQISQVVAIAAYLVQR